MKSTIKVKTLLGIIGVLLLAIIFHHYITFYLFTSSNNHVLVSFANEVNQNCPFMLNAQTRMDNITVGEGNSIIYNYTLINYKKDELNLKYFKNKLRPLIVSAIKINPKMNFLKDRNVTFEYNYKDKNGIFITLLKISPWEYKK